MLNQKGLVNWHSLSNRLPTGLCGSRVSLLCIQN